MQTSVDLYAAARAAGVDLMWSSALLPLGGVGVREYSREMFHGFRTSSVDRSTSFAQDAFGSKNAKVSWISGANGGLVPTSVEAQALDGGRRRFAITQTGVYGYMNFGAADGGLTSGWVLATPGAFGGLDFIGITVDQAVAIVVAEIRKDHERRLPALTAVTARYSISVRRDQVEDVLL